MTTVQLSTLSRSELRRTVISQQKRIEDLNDEIKVHTRLRKSAVRAIAALVLQFGGREGFIEIPEPVALSVDGTEFIEIRPHRDRLRITVRFRF